MDSLRERYYGALVNKFPVKVVEIPGKNKALVALKPFQNGEVVFMEAPLGSLQHGTNKLLVDACDHCHKFAGTLKAQLNKLCTITAPKAGFNLPAEVIESVAAEFEEAFAPLPDDWEVPAIDAEDSVLSDVVPCKHGCEAIYCSEMCRDTAERQYHLLLCPSFGVKASEAPMGDGDDEDEEGEDEHDEGEVNAAVLFAQMSASTNEIFLLAARLIGRVLEAWVRNGNDLDSALLQCNVLHSQPWPELFAKHVERKSGAASSSSSSGATGTGVGDSDMGGGGDGNPMQLRITEWMRDSLTILRSLVRERMPAFVEVVEAGVAAAAAASQAGHGHSHGGHGCGHSCSDGHSCSSASSSSSASSRPPSLRSLRDWEFDALFSEEVYSRLIGAFELNNIEVKVSSPVTDVIEAIQCLPKRGGAKSPHRRAMAVLGPVLEQIAAAKAARKQLLRRLTQLEEEGGGDDGDDGHDHHGHSHDDDDEEEEGEDESMGSEGHGSDGDGEDEEDDDYEDVGSTGRRRLRQQGYEESSGSDDEEDEDAIDPSKLFPHMNGTALFALVSQMNHSCVPNVGVMYYGGNRNAAVQATRNIASGEELCINYVDVSPSRTYAQRQQDLQHYGFTCTCQRCAAEVAAAGSVSGGK